MHKYGGNEAAVWPYRAHSKVSLWVSFPFQPHCLHFMSLCWRLSSPFWWIHGPSLCGREPTLLYVSLPSLLDKLLRFFTVPQFLFSILLLLSLLNISLQFLPSTIFSLNLSPSFPSSPSPHPLFLFSFRLPLCLLPSAALWLCDETPSHYPQPGEGHAHLHA